MNFERRGAVAQEQKEDEAITLELSPEQQELLAKAIHTALGEHMDISDADQLGDVLKQLTGDNRETWRKQKFGGEEK